MLQDLFELVGKIRVDTSGLDSALSEAKGKVEGVGNSFKDVGKSMSKFGGSMTKKVTLPLVGVGVAAAKIGMDFESGMSKVKAVTGATTEEMKKMDDMAQQLGESTSFSAKEAAEGMGFLGMAGFETNEILSAMPAMLDLAGAGQLDLGTASDIASNILSGFNMEADEAGHMADVLAKAASSANTDVGQLGEAMKYLAPAASSLGWNLEESAAAIQIVSDSGIQGSMAGRAFATSLQRLAKPTAQMQKKMDELGIEFFDAQGNMKPLTEIVGDLEGSFEGLTAKQKSNAITTLFGAEASKHWTNIIAKGSGELGNMEDALKNSNGAAKEMRETMEDNLQGDIKKLTSALSAMAIKIYKDVGPSLRKLVQALTEVVKWFANLSPATQKMIGIFLLLLAAVGPIILILGKFAMAIGSIMMVGGRFIGIFTRIIGIFGTFGGAAAKAGGLLSRFLPLIVRFATMIPRLFNPLGLAITAFLVVWKLLLNALGMDTKEAIQWLIDGIVAGAKKVGEWLLNLGNAIIDGLKALLDGAISLFMAFMDWVVSAVATYVETLKSFWSQVLKIIIVFVKKAIEWFTTLLVKVVALLVRLYVKAKDITGKMATAVLKAFTRMVVGAINAGKKIVKAIVGAFQDAWSGAMSFVKKAASLGLDFAKGIAKGISSGAKFLKDAIVGIGKKAIRSFKDFFSIESPSKVMAAEARWIPEGIAVGISKNAKSIGGAMDTVGEFVQDGYDKAIGGVRMASLPSIGNILPKQRKLSIAGVDGYTGDSRSQGQNQPYGNVNVNVRRLENANSRQIQNQVERNFFRKARQRE